ncbi:MAG TPA: hypothetical protein VFR34_07025 [Paracoccaceae bacterium]|nr:hypothetical protein [Paracoccaceae bacterium]
MNVAESFTAAGVRCVRAARLLWAGALVFLCLGSLAAAPDARADTRQEIDAKVKAGLEALHKAEPGTRELSRRALAILVFPEIVKGGVIIGGLRGEGALLQKGRNIGYFATTGLTIGLQAR